MTIEEMLFSLDKIIDDFNAIGEPKYRNADLESLKSDLEVLKVMKPEMRKDQRYLNIINAITQTIKRMEKPEITNPWLNLSERGINKSIPPVVKKKGHTIEFPFEWIDEKSGHICSINSEWDARNYMVMDIVGYMLLLKEGGEILPEKPLPIFKDIESINQREKEFDCDSKKDRSQDAQQEKESIESFIDKKMTGKYFVRFWDEDFRKFTGLKMSSNDIFNLLLETSRVEFKLTYPVRIMEGKDQKEKLYRMNIFSRLFELRSADKETRNSQIVQSRIYGVSFNTILGELFAHNLLSRNYDWLDNRFYSLPRTSQVFFRRFLLHHNYKDISFKIETIKERLNLKDSNITNLIATIETNILGPLKESGLIDSYRKETEGLNGIKFIIKRSHKIKPKELTHDPKISIVDGGSVKKG